MLSTEGSIQVQCMALFVGHNNPFVVDRETDLSDLLSVVRNLQEDLQP